MPDVSIVVPRLDSKPWGGRTLSRYGFELPPDVPIGEALVTAGDAGISDGYGVGRTLGDVVAEDPATRLGELATAAVSGREIFPLLVKLIDAAENLSIQVHPNDAQAESLDRLGKTEAWHVLAAEPGAKLYIGIDPATSLDAFAEAARKLDGTSATLMRAVDAVPGETILIPAGTVHALGAGVMVYEIQQPSDVTFRLDDWGRVDAQGNPREMHLDQGFAVARPELLPAYLTPIALDSEVGSRKLLVATRYFGLERVELAHGEVIELPVVATSPQVVTAIAGSVTVSGGTSGGTLQPGHSAVIWPNAGGFVAIRANEDATILRSWVPDLATEIIAPARAAGADDEAIAAIGEPAGDIRAAL